MVIFIDSNSQPDGGFQFTAKQRKKDDGWDLTTREITNNKTWVKYYEACANYYIEKDDNNWAIVMCDRIISDYPKVREAVADSYKMKGDISFNRAEKEIRDTESEVASDTLKPLYTEAIGSYEKVLIQKDTQPSLDFRTKCNLGICHYRLVNYNKAEKYLKAQGRFK